MKLRVLIGFLAAIVVFYAAEDLSVRYRIPRAREPLGTVVVQRYDAIPQKNGKVKFDFEQPVNQTCVRTLLPHLGYSACWYLRRHAEQRINY